jgi:hypothetical protein
VNVTEEEEAIVAATYDPISGMAVIDLETAAMLAQSLPELDDALMAVVNRTQRKARDEPERESASEPDRDIEPVDTDQFLFGYVHWGTTNVTCDGDSILALTRMYEVYKAAHGGRDKGFVEAMLANMGEVTK